MKILFLMKRWKEEAFLEEAGVRELLHELKICGDSWEYRQNSLDPAGDCLEKSEKAQRMIDPNRRMETADWLVITDCMDAAQQLKEQRICCIGYQKADAMEFFWGVSDVITSFENLDRTYLEAVHHHYHGIPVQIARSERLVIRESIREDFEELYRISKEAGNERYMEIPSSNRALEKEKFEAYISQIYKWLGFGLWTVIRRDTNEIIGRCGLTALGEANDRENFEENENFEKNGIEIGYLIGREHRRNGYAKEACEAILHYADQTLDCQEIWARIHKENIASRKLAEGLGFEKREEIEDQIWYKKSGKQQKIIYLP